MLPPPPTGKSHSYQESTPWQSATARPPVEDGGAIAGRANRGQTSPAPSSYVPPLPQVATTFDLNIIVSLALRELLTQWISPERIKVKWPNDLMVDHRKDGGITLSKTKLERCPVGLCHRRHRPQRTPDTLCPLPPTSHIHILREPHPISQEEWIPPMLQDLTQLLQHYAQAAPPQH